MAKHFALLLFSNKKEIYSKISPLLCFPPNKRKFNYVSELITFNSFTTKVLIRRARREKKKISKIITCCVWSARRCN